MSRSGALDALTRIEMQRLLEQVWLSNGFTAILVTHDVTEAVALGDRIVLIGHGTIAADIPVALARPRQRGSADFARMEAAVLEHPHYVGARATTAEPRKSKLRSLARCGNSRSRSRERRLRLGLRDAAPRRHAFRQPDIAADRRAAADRDAAEDRGAGVDDHVVLDDRMARVALAQMPSPSARSARARA